MQVPSTDSSSLRALLDDELLRRIAARDEDSELARESWAELYRRHVSYLYGVCYRAYASLLGGESGVSDLVADTFRRVYEKAGLFDADGLTEPRALQLRARAWMGTIAANLARDALRRRRRIPTETLEHDRWNEVAQRAFGASTESKELSLVREAIASLSEREQLVLRVTFQWYELDGKQQRLPTEVLGDLAAALGTSPESVRQARRRALNKVRVFMKRVTERQEDAV